MTAIIKIREKEIETKANLPLYRIYEINDLSPQAFIAVKNAEVIPEDTRINDGDIIELIAVVSGG